jgi:hypothetical protein
MKTRDIAIELDRAFAAATRHALMNGAMIGDKVDTLYVIHTALNASHTSASGLEMRCSTKLWLEITRPSRSSRLKQQSK